MVACVGEVRVKRFCTTPASGHAGARGCAALVGDGVRAVIMAARRPGAVSIVGRRGGSRRTGACAQIERKAPTRTPSPRRRMQQSRK